MTIEPWKPLTPTEHRVSRLVSIGYPYARIAELLGIPTASTVRVHVYHIAAKLPNPDNLSPYTLVLLWSAERRFLEQHSTKENAA